MRHNIETFIETITIAAVCIRRLLTYQPPDQFEQRLKTATTFAGAVFQAWGELSIRWCSAKRRAALSFSNDQPQSRFCLVNGKRFSLCRPCSGARPVRRGATSSMGRFGRFKEGIKSGEKERERCGQVRSRDSPALLAACVKPPF